MVVLLIVVIVVAPSGVSCSGTSPHPTGPEDSADCEVCNILITIEIKWYITVLAKYSVL